MAKAKSNTNGFTPRSTRKRKGVHSKSKNSSHKRSKNYRKKYRGQGR